MNSQQHTEITTQDLKEFGFHQIEPNSYSNGRFDLILSGTGAVILYVQGQRSTSCIADVAVLKSLINYNIISSVGINKYKLN